jgi:thiosulfate/3-mercaptopyruvate sulfurtransferase
MTEQEIQEKGYAHPEALVSTEWVAQNLDDTQNIRIVESDEDVLLYDIGHVPNAVKVDWVEDLNDPLTRDYLDPEHFANLMSEKGITPETTVVFYGDKNNWWATYALWVFRLFGHDNVRVMDGGRVKWEAEGREMTQEVPSFERTDYPVPERDDSKIRAFRQDVEKHLGVCRRALAHARLPAGGRFAGWAHPWSSQRAVGARR